MNRVINVLMVVPGANYSDLAALNLANMAVNAIVCVTGGAEFSKSISYHSQKLTVKKKEMKIENVPVSFSMSIVVIIKDCISMDHDIIRNSILDSIPGNIQMHITVSFPGVR
jgi:hypothetical protein